MVQRVVATLAIFAAIECFTCRSSAQSDNPVYLDDSPAAWELFRQAEDQTRNNAGEAVRLYQELLDEFALKLIPVSEAANDHFKAVRQRVIAKLYADQALLDRYRLIQTPEADRLLQAGELNRLAMTRPLTEPGLEAMLRVAQQNLETARFSTAASWLQQAAMHPDLRDRRAASCFFMMGLASHYLQDSTRFQASLDSLTALGDDGQAYLAQLQQRAADNDRPEIHDGLSTLHRGAKANLDDLVRQAIWHEPLEHSLLRRKMLDSEMSQPANEAGEGGANRRGLRENAVGPAGAIGGPGSDQRLQDSVLTTATPTVAGPVVYINQGHTVLALNRLTGRKIWSYSDTHPLALLDRESGNAMDLSVVAVSEGAVVTLTGHAQSNERSESGQVICLNADTGSKRWATSFSGLVEGAAGENLFPHGAPIIADGMVFVAARKVSVQSLTSAYVVAMNLEDGQVRWLRHITSSGGLRAGRPFCSLLHGQGALYVASAVGATARLEPATGEIHWLQRFNVPITAGILDQARRPWEMSGPVLTPRGLVAVQPDQRRIVLLDIENGDVLESHDAGSSAEWNLPRYLLADDARVYSIGSEIRAFHVDNLEVPIWRLPELIDNSGENQPHTISSIDIRGRVQVVDGAVIVPTAEGVLVVHHETGFVQTVLAVQPVGNPLAIDSQLLLASGDRLDAYMSFSTAQSMLRDRIAEAPNEPEPALSLLRLSMRVRNLPLTLEASDLAMAAINRLALADPNDRHSIEMRGELFYSLLEAAQAKLATTTAEGESLYAAIGAVAVDSQQRVEHLLAYGDWLSAHAIDRAVESYQTILSDRTLANAWRINEDAMRPASSWAVQRLGDLIAQRGPNVYAPQADFAALRLRQFLGTPATSLPNGTAATPEDLSALAAEFPLAQAAIDAALAASKLHMAAGNTRDALAALITAHHAAPREQTASQLLGSFVSICEQSNYHAQAVAALQHVLRQYGDLELVNHAGQQRTSVWLAALQPGADQSTRLAFIGTAAGEALPLEGSFIGAYDQRASVVPPDRALLREGAKIHLISSSAMQPPMWTTTVEGELPQVLRFDDRGILLWFGADPQDPKAVMLNPGDGQLRWTSPRIADVLGDVVRDLGRARGIRDQMPDGEPFDPRQTLPLVNDQMLIVVQRTGGVAALDLAGGQVAKWFKNQTLEQVHFAALHDCALVLAGMARDFNSPSGNAELVPRILILHPQTGEPLLQHGDDDINLIGRAGVKWLNISPLGLLSYATDEGLDVIDLYTGQRQWSNSSYAALDSKRGWQLQDHLIIEDQRSRLRSIDLRDGSVSDGFEMPVRGEWEPLGLQNVLLVNEHIVACYPQRVVIYEPRAGTVAGNDVISDERDYRWLLPAQDSMHHARMLLINARSSQVQLTPQPGMRSQFVYRLYVLSENAKVLGEPMIAPALGDKVQLAAVIDGWLLLSTQTKTLAIPVPVEQTTVQ